MTSPVRIALMLALAAGVVPLAQNSAPAQQAQAQTVASEPYQWKNVAINGNGFIDGIVYSKAADNTVFIHTDMGGAYRWDQSLSKWMPMTDWLQIGDSAQYNGAESMAADPTDPNRVYLVAGTYQSTAAILRSTDGGRTWLRTDVSGIQVNGNGWGRGLGERMAIDPNSPNIIYYGAHYFDSTHKGLWKSTDYAATWNQATSFTNYGDVWNNNYTDANGVGIPFVIFDKSSGTAGSATPVIYAASDSSRRTATKLYRTSDGGATWSAMPGQPTTTDFPQRATLSADGAIMYVTYGSQAGPLCSSDTGGMVYKITNPKSANPTWTAVTPSGGSGIFTAIAMDPTNSNIVYTSAQNNWPCNIWRSTNGGSSWTALNPDSNRDNSSAPWASQQAVHQLTDLEISPFNHDVAMFNTGFGIYRTTNLTAATPTWSFFNAGFEQSVPMELDSPNTGSVHLVSAVGDRGGYRHVDFNVAQSGLGQSQGLMVGTDSDIKAAWNDANYVVRVTYTSPYVQYSNDNGVTWTWGPTTSLPANANAGYAAISADGLYVVYAGGSSVQPVYATRSGTGSSATWSAWQTPSSNRPAANARVIADLAAAHTFYAISGTTTYRSTDGGITWTTMSSNVSALSSITGIRPVPGNSGHMLASTGTWSGLGLLRSTDGGATWNRLSSSAVSIANEVGVGAAAPGQSYPAIYVAGTVNGLNGFFRSDDQGATWVTISDLAHQYGATAVIQGDPRVYGRLYVGAHGRGILYGDIHNAPSLPSGWSTQDIGSPGSAGSAGSASTGSWEVTGGGAGITGTADQFRFAYTPLTGDGSITARVLSNPSDTPSNHNALAGVMIRSDLTAGSANVLMAMSPGSVNGAVFKYRTTAGGSASTANAAGVWNPYWVRLARVGNTFTAYRSADGATWTQVGTAQSITMNSSVYVGLAATAADNNQLNICKFDNVSVQTSNGAAPTVATAASASSNPVTGTTTTLSVLGADDGGEANLTYTWAATGTPPAAVTFSANGTNAAKSTTATFTTAGTYSFQVTITDAGGLSTTSSANVTVNQTLTRVDVTPATATVNTSVTQQFAATGYDQFGQALTAQPTFTWSILSGGGTIRNRKTGRDSMASLMTW